MGFPAWIDLILILALGMAVIQTAQVFFLSRTVRLEFFLDDRGLSYGLGDDEIQALVEEMEIMGFTLLGVMTEQPWFSRPIPSLILAWTEQKAFASITRIAAKVRFFYYSPFTGGQVLLSANGYFGKIKAKGCVVQTIKNASAQQLWQAHQERLQAFIEQGYTPIAEYSPTTRQQAARRFYAHPAIIRWMGYYQVRSCLLSMGGLVLLTAILGVGLFVYLDKKYSPPAWPTSTPKTARADFQITGVQVHHCEGSTDENWVSFSVQNIGGFTFQGADILVEAPAHSLVLYGEAPGVGIPQPGFHTTPEQCGLGEQASLPPGSSAYLARRLEVAGCTFECQAHARIKMCIDPNDMYTCIVRTSQFSVFTVP